MKTMMYAVCLMALTGCVAEDETSSTETALVGGNKLGLNKLGLNKLGLNKLGLNKLGLNSLETRDLVSTPDGREVMSYVVSCALPTGQSVTLTDDEGTEHTFGGWLNLAPAWGTRAPTVSERRWVSACLLARTNVFGVPVSISMRHDSNLALLSSAAERAEYTRAEGSFYGDLFTTNQTWYACSNRAWTQYEPDSFRACALSSNGYQTDCTFTFTGSCASACSDKTAPFNGCRGGGTSYNEVITIFLTPTQQQGDLE